MIAAPDPIRRSRNGCEMGVATCPRVARTMARDGPAGPDRHQPETRIVPTSPDEPQPPTTPEPSAPEPETTETTEPAALERVAPEPQTPESSAVDIDPEAWTPTEPLPTSPVASSAPRASLTSDHRLTVTWQAIGAIALVVGLLTGVITLLDRFTATAPPVITPAPTAPHITVDVSSPRGASTLIDFLEEHSDGATGTTVELDISCYETVARPACILESSPVDIPDRSATYWFLWLFGDEPCFDPSSIGGPLDPDYSRCTETSVMWIDPRVGDAPVVFGNIQGASTTAIKGTWVIRAPMGAGVFPANIHGYRVTPFGVTTLVEEPSAAGSSTPAEGPSGSSS